MSGLFVDHFKPGWQKDTDAIRIKESKALKTREACEMPDVLMADDA